MLFQVKNIFGDKRINKLVLGLRPERISITPHITNNKDKIVGVITDASYFGETTYYKVECGLNAQALTISSQNSFNQVNYKIGDKVELIADMNSVVGLGNNKPRGEYYRLWGVFVS